jgi:hypothetical protein
MMRSVTLLTRMAALQRHYKGPHLKQTTYISATATAGATDDHNNS